MKATVNITFKDGTEQSYFEGDYFYFQFKNDLEDRNNAFVKIGDNFVRKDEIRSATAIIEKAEGEAK